MGDEGKKKQEGVKQPYHYWLLFYSVVSLVLLLGDGLTTIDLIFLHSVVYSVLLLRYCLAIIAPVFTWCTYFSLDTQCTVFL